jgi:hypothetical protein
VCEFQYPSLESEEETKGDGGDESRLKDLGDGFWAERFKHD